MNPTYLSSWSILTAAAIVLSACASSDQPSSSTEVPTSSTEAPRAHVARSMTPSTLGAANTGHGGPVAVQSSLADPNVVATLRGLALRAASGSGVSAPTTMQVVAVSDHQVAETTLSGAIINDHAPVYVITITGGSFTARRHPPGVPAPQGAVLTLTIDAATYRVTDLGYVPVVPDLSQIGSAPVDLLAP